MPTTTPFRLSTYLTLALACASLGYAEAELFPEVGVFAALVVVALAVIYRLEGRVGLLSIPDANKLGAGIALCGAGGVVLAVALMVPAGLGFALQVRLRQMLDDVREAAAGAGALEDARTADALADLHVRCETIRLLAWKGLTDVERYGQPGPEGSLVKWLWSDTNQRLTQLAVDVLGPDALAAGGTWSYELLRARGNSIEGGTTEILKNIVAERVLGLPRLAA